MANIPTLGSDQQTPGLIPFWRLIAPNDFDRAAESMRIILKDELGAWDEMKYLGLFGGTLKDWLKDYIEASHALNKSLSTWNRNAFLKYFAEHFPDYDADANKVYFSAYEKALLQNKIPATIAKAYSYTPTKLNVVGEAGVDIAKYLLKYGAVAVIGYMLVKELMFKGGARLLSGSGTRRSKT